MKRRLYPVVLEGGPRGIFGAWFPDFPGCVAGGKSLEEAIAKAEAALARAVDTLAENLPEPTPIGRIELPKGCKPLAYFMVGVDPPDPSERVNIYLPKSLLARVDQKATQLGMSRSSFFGLAVSTMLDPSPTPIYLRAGLATLRASSEPRPKARKVGKLRAAKPQERK